MHFIDEETQKPDKGIKKVIDGDKPKIAVQLVVMNHSPIEKKEAEKTDSTNEKKESQSSDRELFQDEKEKSQKYSLGENGRKITCRAANPLSDCPTKPVEKMVP
jgi:hypothetical protein